MIDRTIEIGIGRAYLGTQIQEYLSNKTDTRTPFAFGVQVVVRKPPSGLTRPEEQSTPSLDTHVHPVSLTSSEIVYLPADDQRRRAASVCTETTDHGVHQTRHRRCVIPKANPDH